MRSRRLGAWCFAAALSRVSAAVLPAEVLEARQDSSCTNGPYTRACWYDGYSIATDFDQKWPTTGNTVSQYLEVTNGTCNPDGGQERICLLVNGQYPGPVVRASWGDVLSVTIANKMQDNGTSIHWHGVRQFNTPGMDGVNGITECPLAPGETKTYTFHVTQFGSSWYHAHFSSQYGDGVVGPMVLDGPASANYDVDLGPYMLGDWYYVTAFQMDVLASNALQSGGPPPAADNILINGTNKNGRNNGGAYNQVKITKNKKYRLRLINYSADNYIRVSLDGHLMQVMTTDFVPIQPFTTQTLLLAVGQRYDVVIKADQAPGNYWFRASVATDCLSANNFHGLAVWSYDTVNPATPTSTAYSGINGSCAEPSPAAPYWKQAVSSDSFSSQVQDIDVTFTKAQVVPNGGTLTIWALGGTSIDVDWQNPTIGRLMAGNTTFPSAFGVTPTMSEGVWNYVVVQQGSGMPPVPHPFHLHGHDFFVLGTGTGQFSAGSASLNFQTPTRRDTATVPGTGWLAIAFMSNNPGTWLMHCHIAWHISEGLGLQFLESPSSVAFPEKEQFQQQCKAWDNYYKTSYYKKDDSGI